MEQLTETLKEQAFNHQESGYRPRRHIATDLMAFRSRVRELSKEAGTEMALERRAGLPVGSLSHYSRARPASRPAPSGRAGVRDGCPAGLAVRRPRPQAIIDGSDGEWSGPNNIRNSEER